MSIFRVYFFDEKGNELSDHPLNGKQWLGSSGYIYHNGEFRKPYRTQVCVADYASARKIHNERKVTVADFKGHKKVGVKVWHGPAAEPDKFWLVPDDYLSNRV